VQVPERDPACCEECGLADLALWPVLEHVQDASDAGGLLGGLGADVDQVRELAAAVQLALDVVVQAAPRREGLIGQPQNGRFSAPSSSSGRGASNSWRSRESNARKAGASRVPAR
jgi:hypothetical protein